MYFRRGGRVHRADGTGRIAQRKFKLSKISKIRLRRQMGFWIGMLPFRDFFGLFFAFPNYNLEDGGVFYIGCNKFSTRKLGGSCA